MQKIEVHSEGFFYCFCCHVYRCCQLFLLLLTVLACRLFESCFNVCTSQLKLRFQESVWLMIFHRSTSPKQRGDSTPPTTTFRVESRPSQLTELRRRGSSSWDYIHSPLFNLIAAVGGRMWAPSNFGLVDADLGLAARA
jgi:hypothetical protein